MCILVSFLSLASSIVIIIVTLHYALFCITIPSHEEQKFEELLNKAIFNEFIFFNCCECLSISWIKKKKKTMYVASLIAHMVKNLPVMQEMQVQSLGWEDPLEKEMATYSSILAWRIPWTEEPGGLQSMRSQRVGHD